MALAACDENVCFGCRREGECQNCDAGSNGREKALIAQIGAHEISPLYPERAMSRT
jgi:hypothetical protein